jgi:nicotinamidase-related amidase
MNKNSALLLIEFQNEWLLPEGKLYHLMEDKGMFASSQQNAQECLTAARQANLPVIHSGLSFSVSYQELGQANAGLRAGIKAKRTFLAGSEGADFHGDFTPHPNEFVTTGRLGSSAFCGSNLDIYLKRNHIETLYIAGYALQVCVESTVRQAHDEGYNVIVIGDACAAFNADIQRYVVEQVMPHFGEVMSHEEFITQLEDNK